jgi:hypothetical protein
MPVLRAVHLVRRGFDLAAGLRLARRSISTAPAPRSRPLRQGKPMERRLAELGRMTRMKRVRPTRSLVEPETSLHKQVDALVAMEESISLAPQRALHDLPCQTTRRAVSREATKVPPESQRCWCDVYAIECPPAHSKSAPASNSNPNQAQGAGALARCLHRWFYQLSIC